MKIQLFKPKIRDSSINKVTEALTSGWLGMGAKCIEFENALSHYFNAERCALVNSGTAAIHLSLKLLDLPKGSEVITSPITFPAVNHTLLYEQLTPIFADVEPDTGNLSPKSVREKITERTGAVIILHYGGYPCDLDEIDALCRERRIALIEDCAHAIGSEYKGQRIGSRDTLQTFSFDPTKNLTAAGLGLITGLNESQLSRIKRLRYLGMNSDSFNRFNSNTKSFWEYDITEVGYRYHPDDVRAALGLGQLAYLDEDNLRRQEIADLYDSLLKGIPGITLPKRSSEKTSCFFLYPILAEARNELAKKLSERDIGISVHFRRNDEYPMYKHSCLPGAQFFTEHELSLPMHVNLTNEEIQYIANVIKEGW